MQGMMMMMIAFITVRSSLVPLIEGLCAQTHMHDTKATTRHFQMTNRTVVLRQVHHNSRNSIVGSLRNHDQQREKPDARDKMDTRWQHVACPPYSFGESCGVFHTLLDLTLYESPDIDEGHWHHETNRRPMEMQISITRKQLFNTIQNHFHWMRECTSVDRQRAGSFLVHDARKCVDTDWVTNQQGGHLRQGNSQSNLNVHMFI